MPDWDKRYADLTLRAEPARVLEDFAHLLPFQGEALDLACGLGGNALLLAKHGLKVRAWDRSPQAIARVREASAKENLDITAEVRDVVRLPPAPESWDVIVVSRFLERSLATALVAALRCGGLLYYQTFVREAVHLGKGPRQREYRLGVNELSELFSSLRLIVYREEGRLGDLGKGFRDEAYGVFQRNGHAHG